MAKKKRGVDAGLIGLDRLGRNEARKLLSFILSNGATGFSDHALDEMAADDLTSVDVANVLRAGRITEDAELVDQSWRYRVGTERMIAVVAFRTRTEIRVVTVWRKKS